MLAEIACQQVLIQTVSAAWLLHGDALFVPPTARYVAARTGARRDHEARVAQNGSRLQFVLTEQTFENIDACRRTSLRELRAEDRTTWTGIDLTVAADALTYSVVTEGNPLPKQAPSGGQNCPFLGTRARA